MKTTDDRTYYNRNPSNKEQFIFDFVKEHNDEIQSVFDVGCNNGNMSYRLQTELGKNVFGVDYSDELKLPSDYKFANVDISKFNEVYCNDFTLFLSLYHHLIGAYGLEAADDVWFKLLLSTKYMVFDTGNTSEKKRRETYWYNAQKNIFNSETDLLNHFGIDYKVIGEWDVAGGRRNLVVFDKNSFDKNVTIESKFKRCIGSKNQYKGLVNTNDVIDQKLYDGTVFYKLKIGDKRFFSKKHECNKMEADEFNNIKLAYKNINSSNLIKFYGVSEKYGFVYEWLDEFNYIGKECISLKEKTLTDVDVIMVDDVKKYIDFWK